ncbi:hypothetical protein FM106_19830 [Brachybacterium faecium]|nr:hypothetical protein FM106_19830 [Brachybacterium faecium]
MLFTVRTLKNHYDFILSVFFTSINELHLNKNKNTNSHLKTCACVLAIILIINFYDAS